VDGTDGVIENKMSERPTCWSWLQVEDSHVTDAKSAPYGGLADEQMVSGTRSRGRGWSAS
jgi:hypothetical protein